jgi:hypothetical protein
MPEHVFFERQRLHCMHGHLETVFTHISNTTHASKERNTNTSRMICNIMGACNSKDTRKSKGACKSKDTFNKKTPSIAKTASMRKKAALATLATAETPAMLMQQRR